LVCSLWSLVVVVVLLWTSSESYFEFYGFGHQLQEFCKSFFSFASLSLSICVNSLFWVSIFFGGGWVLVLLLSQKLSSLLIIPLFK
jgi:hypothetical protein